MIKQYPHHRVLLIEDDKTLNRLMLDQVQRLGYDARSAASREDTLEVLRDFSPDLAILDIRLPDTDGITFLPELREYCAVMIQTAYGSIDQAVNAVKAGATEFLVKPVSPQNLEMTLTRFFETVALKRDLAFWQAQAQNATRVELVGDSAEMAEVRHLVSIFAAADTPVLICGESGVGKEAVAAAIHAQSTRTNGRFISVDCDDALNEAALFGQETSARERSEGLIAAADNGTIFLNDIDKLAPALQSKLLRVMESGAFRPLGASRTLPSSARFLAATGVDLENMALMSHFKNELYYLLSSLRITMAPLRARKNDVLALAEHFLQNRNFHRGVEKAFAPETFDALESYDWPGNLRELRNAIERGVIMSAGTEVILPEHITLPSQSAGLPSGVSSDGLTLRFEGQPTMDKIRDTYVRLLLDKFAGNRKQVAQALGMSERNTYRMLKKIDL
ncbi:MAG: sigma-54 dependent transcriptional regulator [Rhodobacteraceae bacterium]|nr:sigma-54 dependent transcriptional regulator [Paracoccaceae bacterium]